MVLTTAFSGSYAMAQEDYSDYVPADIPQNIIKDPANLNGLVGSNGGAATFYRGENNSWDSQKKLGYLEKSSAADAWFGAGPTLIGGSYLNSTIVKDTAYVFSVRLANGAPERKATLKAAVGYGTNIAPVSFDVTSSEFQTYTGTFTAQVDAGSVYLGFDTNVDRRGVTDDTRGLLVHDYSNGGSFYVAPEMACSISINLEAGNYIAPGSEISVDTAVLNQLGEIGSLSQDVDCKVLTSDRSAVAQNISVQTVSDGKLLLSVPGNVKEGKYVLFVSSKDYTLRKGIEIEVLDPSVYVDYVPGDKNANMIANPYTANSFTGSNGAAGIRLDYNGEAYINLKETVNDSGDAWFGAGPVHMTGMKFEKDKNYVVSAFLRNSTFPTSSTLYFGFNYRTNAAPISIPVENTEFEPYTFTFTAESDSSFACFGLDGALDNSHKTEDELGNLHFSIESDRGMYIAEEQAYDIILAKEGEGANVFSEGDSITFDAKLVNQVGTEGMLGQDFSWVALSKGKTAFAENIEVIADENDSSKVTVNFKEGIESGTYHLIARSEKYPEFIRSYAMIVNPKIEYTPAEKPANLFPQEKINAIDGYTESNGSGGVRVDYDGETYINLVEKGVYDSWFGAGPVYKTITTPLEVGKSYVASFNVRNVTPEITPTLYFGLNHKVNNPPVSVPVTNTEFETKKMVFVAQSESSKIFFGFDATRPSKTENLGGMHIDFSQGNEPYVAEEIPYMLKLISDTDKPVLYSGDSFEIEAELLNQLEIKGNLVQKFNWMVLDANRTPVSESFELSVSQDSTTAVLTHNGNAVAGTYYLAAESDCYEDVIRFFEFSVKKDGLKIYVAPYGDDSADGSIEEPFKTIEKASKVVAGIANKDEYKSIEIILRGGDYRLPKTIKLGAENSGTSRVPVVYKAYQGETPVIKGSVELDVPTARQPLSENVVKRIRPEVQDKVIVFDLKENGISDSEIVDLSGSFASFYSLTSAGEQNTLFIDGKEQIISSWPNDRDYATRGDAIAGTSSVGEDICRSFYYTDSEPDRWTEAQDWYIGAFIPYDYSYARMSGKSVDTANKIIALDNLATDEDFSITNNFTKRWKAFNLLEEIDLPGEYYIDTVNGLLYLYPPYDISESTVEITVNRGNLLEIADAQNITFKGLTFAQSGASAIRMVNVRNVDIDSCVFTGIQGVSVNIYGTEKAQTNKDYWQRQAIDASYDMDITNNVFVNLGSNAVNLSGGNVDTLTPSGNIVENNFISNYATKTTNQLGGAFAISGCGHTIRYNHIGNSVSAAINVDGNDHVIEYNEMYNLLSDYQDAGVIYQGKNALARGTVIRYNYIHDSFPLSEKLTDSTQVAIYVDDAQHGITAENNIIKNVRHGFHSNGGGALTVKGNTVLDAAGRPWSFINQPNGYTKWPTVEKGPGGTVEFIGSQLYDRELYFERYEGLEEFITKGKNPKYYTVIKDNFAVNSASPKVDTEELVYSTVSDNTTVTGSDYSVFVDPDNQDYRLKADSTYAKDTRLTEDNFDMEKIGIQSEGNLLGTVSDFRQIYPYNNAVVAPQGGKLTLSWSVAIGATDYDVVVATDRNFENVVYTKNVRVNTVSISELPEGTYYWKVIANNGSREFATSWQSQNSGNVFTLASHEYAVELLNTSMDSDETEVTLKSRVINNTVTDTSDFVITVAAYSVDKLMDVKQFRVSLSLGEAYDLLHTIDTEGNYDIEEIKIFVWRNNTLIPLRQARVLK